MNLHFSSLWEGPWLDVTCKGFVGDMGRRPSLPPQASLSSFEKVFTRRISDTRGDGGEKLVGAPHLHSPRDLLSDGSVGTRPFGGSACIQGQGHSREKQWCPGGVLGFPFSLGLAPAFRLPNVWGPVSGGDRGRRCLVGLFWGRVFSSGNSTS